MAMSAMICHSFNNQTNAPLGFKCDLTCTHKLIHLNSTFDFMISRCYVQIRPYWELPQMPQEFVLEAEKVTG